MFGIGHLGNGRYYDSLSAQFGMGGSKGNPEGVASLNNNEGYHERQWITYLKTEHLPAIRKKIILKLYENNPQIKEFMNVCCEDRLKEKAKKLAENEISNNPPSNLVDKQFMTWEHQIETWETFLRTFGMDKIKEEVSETLYNNLPADLKLIVDNSVEDSINERARKEVRDERVSEAITASRAAVLVCLRSL